MTPNEAKRIIADALRQNGREHKLTARSVSFSDLARGSRVYVKIHDWEPNPIADALESLARSHGFALEFAIERRPPM